MLVPRWWEDFAGGYIAGLAARKRLAEQLMLIGFEFHDAGNLGAGELRWQRLRPISARAGDGYNYDDALPYTGAPE